VSPVLWYPHYYAFAGIARARAASQRPRSLLRDPFLHPHAGASAHDARVQTSIEFQHPRAAARAHQPRVRHG